MNAPRRIAPSRRVADLTIRLQMLAPDIARGLRAAVLTLGPYYLAAILQIPELSWTALAGWLGTLADPGGPRVLRARQLALFAFTGAAGVASAEVAARLPLAATAWLALAAFALSLLRALGGEAGSLGNFVTIVVAIASARPSAEPVRDAVFFAAGAALALVVSTIVWPVWTHWPVRRAVAAVYDELAQYLDALSEAAKSAASVEGALTPLIRRHNFRVRTAIEGARERIVAARARRQGETRFGGDVRAVLGAGEAEFRLITALALEVETLTDAERRSIAPRLLQFANRCRSVLRVLATRVVATPSRNAPASLRAQGGPTLSPAADIVERLARAGDAALESALSLGRGGEQDPTSPNQLDLATGAPNRFDLATGASLAPAAMGVQSLVQRLRSKITVLRDALAVGSPFLHHALRAGLAAGTASLLSKWVSPVRGYWVTLTTIAVLQPYPGATFKRASERVVGTVLGSVLAVAIVEAVRSPALLSLLLVPLSIAAVATRPRSYRLFTFFLTPVFVLLAGRSSGDFLSAELRVIDAVLGGAIALAFGVLIAPASEAQRLPQVIDPMLHTLCRYGQATLRSAGERATDVCQAQLQRARRDCGIALGAAEIALERFLAEPLRNRTLAASSVLLVTYARRLAASLTAFDTVAVQPLPSFFDEVVARAAGYLERVVAPVFDAQALEPPPEPVDDSPAMLSLDRVVRSAELVAMLRAEGQDPLTDVLSPVEGSQARFRTSSEPPSTASQSPVRE